MAIEASGNVFFGFAVNSGGYMTWQELESYTWTEIEQFTWYELEQSQKVSSNIGFPASGTVDLIAECSGSSILRLLSSGLIEVSFDIPDVWVPLGIVASGQISVAFNVANYHARLKPPPLLAEIKNFLAKIEWLTWDESTVTGEYTGYVVGGNITCDAARDVRRSFSATFVNNDGLFIPNESLTNMGVKLRIYRGILTTYGQRWWSKGIYVLNDPDALHGGANKTVTIQGSDKWALLDGTLGGTLTDTYQIAKDTNVADAIRAVLTEAGETKFRFDTCDVLTPYTITKQPGDTYADLLKELALIPSYELFYDEDGYMVFRPIIDAVNKPVDYDFTTKYRKLYISGSYKPEWSRIKNKWKVIGYSDSTTGITYSGVAEDNNPNSPTNTATPPNGIGVKAEVITDTNLTTNELCVARAQYELNKNLKHWHRFTGEFDFVPFLKVGECILISDPTIGVDGKYEIQSISEPLGLGRYTVEAWKVVA